MELEDDAQGDASVAAIDRSSLVVHAPAIPTTVYWPAPVDQRLNEVLDVLGRSGISISRSELLAALVAACPPEVGALSEVLSAYWRNTVGEVVLQNRGAVVVPPRRPGRRPRAPRSPNSSGAT